MTEAPARLIDPPALRSPIVKPPCASVKQIAYVRSLLAERVCGTVTRQALSGRLDTLSAYYASEWITWLRQQPHTVGEGHHASVDEEGQGSYVW